MSDGRDEKILKEASDADEPLAAAIASSLEIALRVEPSADFLARVRCRIAEEETREEAAWPDRLAGAGAPALVVLALIGAALVGRGPHGVDEPAAARARSVASTAPAAATPAAPLARHPRVMTSPGEPSRARRAPAANVLVEPGQLEALAKVAARAPTTTSAPVFSFESLDAAPLRGLRAGELPRFEPTRLEVRSGGWPSPSGEAAGTVTREHEGSGL